MEQVSFEEGNDRLLELADLLEHLPDNRFDYNHWVGDDWGDAQDLSCGTTACALGWAATIPKLRAVGLRLARYYQGGPGVVHLYDQDDRLLASGTGAAEEVFGITRREASWLFIPNFPAPWDDGEHGPPSNASAIEVAAHIREFISRRREGYRPV